MDSIVDNAHGGSGWIGRGKKDDLLQNSGYGVENEYGQLLKVVLHRPGNELLKLKRKPMQYHWYDYPDINLIKNQCEAYSKKLTELGVNISYLQPRKSKPNHLFLRDLVIMTPEGAILARMASQVRAGEERDMLLWLVENNVPIVGIIRAPGVLEGPDIVYAPRRTVFIATSIRTNKEGANQAAKIFESLGYTVILIQTTYGCGHLDGVLSIISEKLAVVIPTRVSHVITDYLKSQGMELLEVADKADIDLMAINITKVNAKNLIMAKGSNLCGRFQERGITVHEIGLSEVMKGGGSVHCMTAVIERENK